MSLSISPAIASAASGIRQGMFMAGAELGTRNLRETWLEPLAQTMEETYTAARVNQALQAARCSPISSHLGWALYLTPAVAYLASKKIPLAKTVQTHFGTLCLVAYTVSQIAILYFAPTPEAIFSLLFTALALFPSAKYLSKKASTYFGNALFVTAIAAQLILLSSLWACTAVGVGLAARYYWKHGLADAPENLNQPSRLTIEKFQQIYQEELKVEHFAINPAHVHWSSLSKTSETSNAPSFRKQVLGKLQTFRTALFDLHILSLDLHEFLDGYCSSDTIKNLTQKFQNLCTFLFTPSANPNRSTDSNTKMDDILKKICRLLQLEKDLLKEMNYTVYWIAESIAEEATKDSTFAQAINQWWKQRLSGWFDLSQNDPSQNSSEDKSMILAMLYDLHIIQDAAP